VSSGDSNDARRWRWQLAQSQFTTRPTGVRTYVWTLHSTDRRQLRRRRTSRCGKARHIVAIASSSSSCCSAGAVYTVRSRRAHCNQFDRRHALLARCKGFTCRTNERNGVTWMPNLHNTTSASWSKSAAALVEQLFTGPAADFKGSSYDKYIEQRSHTDNAVAF